MANYEEGKNNRTKLDLINAFKAFGEEGLYFQIVPVYNGKSVDYENPKYHRKQPDSVELELVGIEENIDAASKAILTDVKSLSDDIKLFQVIPFYIRTENLNDVKVTLNKLKKQFPKSEVELNYKNINNILF